jgi:alkylation response protein AidB-like acyl-CoA dehydrogenase
MFLDLTEEQKLIQDTARDFAKAELEPVAAALDQSTTVRRCWQISKNWPSSVLWG